MRVAVDDAEIDRVLVLHFVPEHRLGGAIEPDLGAHPGGIAVGQQALDRHLRMFGIAEEGVARAIGRLGRLGVKMNPVGLGEFIAAQIVAFERPQHHQRAQALAVGRAFEHLVAAIGRRDRFDIFAFLRGEILERVQAAQRVELGDDVLPRQGLRKIPRGLA